MKKSTIASLVALAFSPSVFATETAIQTDDVVVTASRVAQARESVIADVTVITREEIERAGQSTFIELLQTQPGVEIASTGGAGKTSSVFLRGTNPGQVVVLIDGLRVSSATSGTTTFENIPLAQIEKIEILRGPATSLYGQDAIGGVIQIFTKKGEGKPQFYAGIGYGSYNTRTADAGINGAINDTKFALSVSSSNTDGFSALRTSFNIDKDRDDYRNLAVTGSVSHQIAEGHEIGIQLFNSEGHSNYDGGVNTFRNYVDLSQLSFGLFSKNQLTSNWKSTVRIGEGVDDQFNQYDAGFSGKFKTKQKQFSWQNDIALPIGTLTLLYDRLEQKVVSDTPYEKTKRNTDGFLVGYLADIGDHSIQTTLRTDHSAQFGTNTTGGIGYGYKINPNWRITGSYGKAFRAPTFNDLYYAYTYSGVIYPSNNPNLKAEKSENFEGSLRYQDEQKDASVTIYQNKINDFITLNQSYIPTNVNAKIEGVTFAASQRWDNLQLKGSIDVQSPRNQEDHNLLVRRANQHASLNLSKSWSSWRFSTEIIASSERYNDANNQTRLAGYSLVNLIADYKINSDLSIQGRVNNLFDKDYALAYGSTAVDGNFGTPSFSVPYNTPASNLFVSVRYSPSK
ncbi:TonB-dependent receptor domain-containing protein [Methylotenera versatilis]|uniref:TonB-dependent receptor n=1 Tax=Methylotenera versatilis (strain 301) TaxID=666681 RepID=D7DKV2_METV0|nr:TonB-dependent receptor [Methylotenera versatilis]ADI28563.1 TonB-dependent receptor [Methylotenera versatilis 301]